MVLYFLFFFFKQKTAYEITVWLEFRRVLFRSMELERNRELKNWNTIFYLANILQHEDFDSSMKYCDGSLIITQQCFAKTKYGIAWKAYTCCCSLGNIVIEIDRNMHQISAAIGPAAWLLLYGEFFIPFIFLKSSRDHPDLHLSSNSGRVLYKDLKDYCAIMILHVIHGQQPLPCLVPVAN